MWVFLGIGVPMAGDLLVSLSIPTKKGVRHFQTELWSKRANKRGSKTFCYPGDLVLVRKKTWRAFLSSKGRL